MSALADAIPVDVPADPLLVVFFSVLTLAMAATVVAVDLVAERRQRAAHAADEARAVAELEAAERAAPVSGRHAGADEAVDTGYVGRRHADTTSDTRVLVLPKPPGVLPWVGVARVPLGAGRRLLSAVRNGWWRA